MRTVSNEMAAAMRNNSTLLAKAVLTLDGAQASEEILPTRIMDARFEQHTSSESSFDLGGAIVGTASVTLWNGDGHFDDYDFTDAVMACYVGKALGATTEWVLIGTYIVDQPDSYAGTIGLSLNDKLSLLSEKKFSDSGLAYPILPLTAMTSMLNSCGIAYIIDCTPVNNAVAISRAPDDDMTLLDAVGHLAQLMGLWLRCDGNGFVHAGWYDTSAFDVGGSFQELGSPYSETVMLDDVIITGVRVTASDEIVVDDDGNEMNGDPGETAMSGSEGYVLSVASNPFVEYGRAAGVASGLFLRAGGMEFRPFERSMPCNPAVEAGDAVSFEDLRGNEHHSYATCAKIVVNGAMELRCSAKSAARNSSAASRASTAAIVKMRSMLDREKTGREVSDNTIMLLAQDAKDVADAVGQHFWHRSTDPDGDGAGTGAFVTDIEREDFLEHINDPTETRPLHNLLMNAEGILLRAAKKIRAAFTPTGMVVYDGQGNEAGNIVASFTGSGVTVGRDGEQHVEIATESTDFFNLNGALVGRIGSGATETIKYTRSTPMAIGESGFTASAVFSPLPDFTAGTLRVTDDDGLVPPGPGILPVYWSVELTSYGTVTDPDQGITVTAAQVDGSRWSIEVTGTNSPDGNTVFAHYWQTGAAPFYEFGTATASGRYAFAEGVDGLATGDSAHTEGQSTTSSGIASHAEGGAATASGDTSHAEGNGTTASDEAAHAEGFTTTASGLYSHAEGESTTASGRASHAQGRGTIASSAHQSVLGTWNVADAADTYIEIVGKGTADNTRSNARTLDWNGNEVLAGGLTLGQPLTIPNGGTGATTASGAWSALGGGSIGKKNSLAASDIPSLPYLPTSGGTVSGGNIIAKSTNIKDGTKPSNDTVGNARLLFNGSDNNGLGWVDFTNFASGVQAIRLYARRIISSTTHYAGLALGLDSSGNATVAIQGTNAQSAWRSAIGVGTIGTKNSLAASDIPNHSTSKLTSGTLGIARGGTGSSQVVSILANSTWTIYAWGPLVMVQCHGAQAAANNTTMLNGTLASYKPAHNVSTIVADTSASNHVARMYVEASSGSVKLASVGYTTSAAWYGTLVYMRVPS